MCNRRVKFGLNIPIRLGNNVRKPQRGGVDSQCTEAARVQCSKGLNETVTLRRDKEIQSCSSFKLYVCLALTLCHQRRPEVFGRTGPQILGGRSFAP